MSYDNRLTAGKLRRWEKFLQDYRLPKWEDIPDFGLYMEQVLALLRQYLDYLPPELKQAEPITAAANQQLCPYKAAAGAAQKALLPHPYRVSHHDLYAQAKPAAVDAAHASAR